MSQWSGKRVAVILAPGGLPGIECHLGAWLACEQAGCWPAWIGGCSAGAIVGAMWAAGRMPCSAAADYVHALRSEDLVRKRWFWKERAFWVDHFCDPAPIREQLEKLLPETFGELHIPLTVAATRMHPHYAESAHFSSGSWLREAVQASSSIAGVWPYVEIDGMPYSDGGTTDAIVMPPDGLHNYDVILVVEPTASDDFQDRDRNMISRLLWNIEALCEKEQAAAHAFLEKHFHDRLIWSSVNRGHTSSLAFSAGHKLIEDARRQVARHLAAFEYAQAGTGILERGAPSPDLSSLAVSARGAAACGDRQNESAGSAIALPAGVAGAAPRTSPASTFPTGAPVIAGRSPVSTPTGAADDHGTGSPSSLPGAGAPSSSPTAPTKGI
jgi:predicted acylesterase/phospholipase RssA